MNNFQKPLAERLRPKSFRDFIGQEHLMGENAPLRKQLEMGHWHSMLFWGPPGVGKTTLAKIIIAESGRAYYDLSAVSSGVKDLKEILAKAKDQSIAPIVFIDEIHRFNKAQQDVLLNPVENGDIILIGATTENPSFEVNSALLSRIRVYLFQLLTRSVLEKMIYHAIQNDVVLQTLPIVIEETDTLIALSGGDARKLYHALEFVVQAAQNKNPIVINNQLTKESIEQNLSRYDKAGDMHYDLVSAFIKSVRGSDPDAALYYLARMIDAGEQVEFILRRMIILAAEDIGLANPNALLLTTQGMEAVKMVGMPEARIILSQICLYLCHSPKSNSAYLAIDRALAFVKKHPDLPVPLHLRNASTPFLKENQYGWGYLYPHDFPNQYVDQEYLPKEAKGQKFYQAGSNPAELKTSERWAEIKKTKD